MIPWCLPSSQGSTQTTCRAVQPFLHSSPQSVAILYNGLPFPLKIARSHGDVDPHLIHGSLGPPEASTQTVSRSVQQFCRAHYTVTDRPTDRQTMHATWSVTTGRIYVVRRFCLMTVIAFYKCQRNQTLSHVRPTVNKACETKE